MHNLLDKTTLFIMLTALVLAVLCIAPQTRAIFPFWIIAAGLQIGDTLFHEIGHALFAWLFGQPAIPMIFTLFGADQAGGMTMHWDRSWIVQGFAFAALIYGCYWVKENISSLFIPSVLLTATITLLAFTRYYEGVIAYMGHGTSILVGGFFLFRAWAHLDSRNMFERWLNALFGFSLILNNMWLSYGLVFDADKRGAYSEHAAFGVVYNDFEAITYVVVYFTVEGIALFTIGLGVLVIISAFIASLYDDKNRFYLKDMR